MASPKATDSSYSRGEAACHLVKREEGQGVERLTARHCPFNNRRTNDHSTRPELLEEAFQDVEIRGLSKTSLLHYARRKHLTTRATECILAGRLSSVESRFPHTLILCSLQIFTSTLTRRDPSSLYILFRLWTTVIFNVLSDT